jgi:DNA-directed RNA polymerase beta' subunit
MARKYSKEAQESVKRAMARMKRGELESGKSHKQVTSKKQAIAIGLSEARKKGYKAPKSSKR